MIAPTYIYRVDHVIRVVDGDTYHLSIDLGFRVTMDLEVRLHGWNTPELNTDAGQVAKSAAAQLLASANTIVVQSFKDARSFTRWVCDVWVDGSNLGELLAKQDLAVPMKG